MTTKILPDVDFLRALVETHSGSRNPAGVARVQDLLSARLERLGLEIQRIPNPDDSAGAPLLIGMLRGQSSRIVDLVTHADTVEEGVGERSPFRLENNGAIAVGPGAMDDKGAQVQTIQALERYVGSLAGAKPPATLRWISAPGEEIGSPGFRAILRDLGKQSSFVLGFEPALEDGSIITARRGNRWYKIVSAGRGGHSGRSHPEGLNAAYDLSLKLGRASALTDYARDLTVSIGSFRTSTDAYNVIPREAEAKLDTRFASFADRDRVDAAIRSILDDRLVVNSSGESTRVSITIEDDCPPFEELPATSAWRDEYRAILARIEGLPVGFRRSGGGADCCYMSHPGLRILDGLGPRGGKMHEREEYVEVASIGLRAEALVEFLGSALPRIGKES